MQILKFGVVTLGAVLFMACSLAGGSVPAEDDPAITAAIDSLLTVAMSGSAQANAAKVLSIAEGAQHFTFVTGDVLLSGLDSIRARFAKTYSGIKSQEQKVLERRVRVLSPDVAVAMVTSEGTYTDSAGVVSQPIGLGLTVVFVRRNGHWVAEHAHQSFVP